MINIYYHHEFRLIKMFYIGLFTTLCHILLLNKIYNYGVFGYYSQQLVSQIFVAFIRCRIKENCNVSGRDRHYLGSFLVNDITLGKTGNNDVTERRNLSMIFFMKYFWNSHFIFSNIFKWSNNNLVVSDVMALSVIMNEKDRNGRRCELASEYCVSHVTWCQNSNYQTVFSLRGTESFSSLFVEFPAKGAMCYINS